MADTRKEDATAALLTSFEARRSRRSLLRGAAATGIAAVGVAALPALRVGAQRSAGFVVEDSPQKIFTIARTAERLAVTLYTNVVANAATLQAQGLTLEGLHQLEAALIEEQLHELFFAANGGNVLASTFSFPDGPSTFTDLGKFIKAQQQLEGDFDSAFIAACYEFAILGRPDLARIACQIAMVESEHRALGRNIATVAGISGYDPADNWTYAPQLIEDVGQAPSALSSAGYLSPMAGNSFTYQQANFNSPTLKPIYDLIMYKDGPFAAGEDSETTPDGD